MLLSLVKPPGAVVGTTSTRYPLSRLRLELVVVCDFHAMLNVTLGKDDDFLLAAVAHHARVTIGVARVVDKPADISAKRRVDNGGIINAEHVA